MKIPKEFMLPPIPSNAFVAEGYEVWGPFVVEEPFMKPYVAVKLSFEKNKVRWVAGTYRDHIKTLGDPPLHIAGTSIVLNTVGYDEEGMLQVILRPLRISDGFDIFGVEKVSTIDGVWEMANGLFGKPEYKEQNQKDIDITALVSSISSCPPATTSISINLANRQQAIDGAGYGPLNPLEPNVEFWRKKAERWGTTYAEAKRSVCGNCSAFIRTPTMLNCISEGLKKNGTDSSGGWDTINAGELGYCEAFDFKCASSRTCDAWIVGGPITEEK